jgi:methylenetetrahydrofolate dehydrogenase (NADP+)/methenyltetrahydrofolate cyclohydrolase
MSAIILDGAKVAADFRNELKDKVSEIVKTEGIQPKLSVILVGSDPASIIYVSGKQKAAATVGIISELHELNQSVSEAELLQLIEKLNNDSLVHGILLQLPLPEHINPYKIIPAIDPYKDVDGFHPENVGLLSIGLPRFISCTPLGVMKLFEAYSINLSGMRACVVGRSNIVGKPMAALLMAANATVTVCHSQTTDLANICKQADILIMAIGKARFADLSFAKRGVVVIDVGMNRTDGKLCGDVNFEEVVKTASYITPVPKGVGPMTIAMLLHNTLLAYQLNNRRSRFT